jgi:glycosyltransferase involved in cell wall biosynthesis
MRVFQLCAGAAAGGAEAAFVDFTIALHQAGVDVTPICRPHPSMLEPLRAAGLTPVTLPFGGAFDWRTKPALRKLISERRPDIVQTWMNRAAKHCPKPDGKLPLFKCVARLGGYYKLKHYKGVDHFVTNTADIRRWLIEQGVAADKVTHINNFADLDQIVTPLSHKDFDTPADAFAFLTLSRLHPVKGIDVFLHALAALPSKKAYGWIAGEGPERAKLEALAQELKIDGRVRFLGWREDRAALLQAADALVFPSRFEPFGNSFAQAWGAGCPLVSSDSEGPRQYVRDGQDALLVPTDDAEALSAAMRRLMDDKALGKKLATVGKARFAQEFTREACIAAYQTLYQSLLRR